MGVKALTGPEPLLCFPLACLGVRFIVRGMKMNPRFTLFVATVFAVAGSSLMAAEGEPGFVSLFDGKTFNGWKKAEEHPEPGERFQRKIGEGTFALQGHDPGSTIRYRNIRVKRLD